MKSNREIKNKSLITVTSTTPKTISLQIPAWRLHTFNLWRWQLPRDLRGLQAGDEFRALVNLLAVNEDGLGFEDWRIN